jgi:sulfur transfer protein SufE
MKQQYPYSLLQKIQDKPHWHDRYKLLMTAAKELNTTEDIKSEKHKVPGCTAKTWLKHSTLNKQHFFEVDSESKIIKGLALLLVDIYNGKSLEDISTIDIDEIFQQLDFKKHLSQSRSNGFFALKQRIIELASHP